MLLLNPNKNISTPLPFLSSKKKKKVLSCYGP